ncbi:MAG: hypothetical protein R8G01_00285 [Ilumatobacteraceae bacterium]|nr:hypothetical protein [Ilumatobacteraceae bacterium]
MLHRIARASRLLVVAALLGVAGASVGSAPAAACSCTLWTARQIVGDALAIVSGEPIDRWDETIDGFDRNVWAFEVDERWVGDTPDVIEIQAEAGESSCGPPAEVGPSILRLGWRASNGRFDVTTGCGAHTVSRDVLDRLFEPPELVEGEPVAVVSADAGGHAAMLADADGRALGYLPGEGETHGLAPCPGGEHFVQLRGGPGDQHGMVRSFELATWSYDGWTEVGVVPVESPEAIETAETIVCNAPHAGDVVVVWSTYSDATRVVDGVATVEARAPERPIDIVGPDDASFRLVREQPPRVAAGATTSEVVWDLGDGWTRTIRGDDLMSVLAIGDGWELTVDDWRETSPDTSESGFRVIRAGPDGRATATSEFVPIRSLGWTSGLLIPPERRSLDGLEPSVPPPLFVRTGTAVEAPSPTTVEPTRPTDVRESADAPEPTDTAQAGGGVDDEPGDRADDDDGMSPRWISGGLLVLVVAAAGVLLARRGRHR